MLQVAGVLETSPSNLSWLTCDGFFAQDSSTDVLRVRYMGTPQVAKQNKRAVTSSAVHGNGDFMDNTIQ